MQKIRRKKVTGLLQEKNKQNHRGCFFLWSYISVCTRLNTGFLWTYCTLRPHLAKRKRVCFACTQYLTPGPDRPLCVRSRAGASLTGPGPRQSWWRSEARPFSHCHRQRRRDLLPTNNLSLLHSISTTHWTLSPLSDHPSKINNQL